MKQARKVDVKFNLFFRVISWIAPLVLPMLTISQQPVRFQAVAYISDDTCGNSGDNGIVRNVFGYHGPSPNQRGFANRNPSYYRSVAADGRAPLDKGFDDLPVGFSLLGAILVNRTRINVVSEHDTMTYKNLVFDRNALANERVRGDLTASADSRILLDLNKR